MYVALSAPAGGGFIHSYSLSTPFDPSTAAASFSFFVQPRHGVLSDMDFSADGATMLVTTAPLTASGGGLILSYPLSTPFDLSTAPVGAAFFGPGTILVATDAASAPVSSGFEGAVLLSERLPGAPPPPAAPANLAALGANASSVTLAWDDPGDAAITGYAILYGIPEVRPGLAVLVPDTGSAAASYTVRGLAPGTTYEFAVAALGPGGQSEPSGTVSVTTTTGTGTGTPPVTPPPPQPPRVCR